MSLEPQLPLHQCTAVVDAVLAENVSLLEVATAAIEAATTSVGFAAATDETIAQVGKSAENAARAANGPADAVARRAGIHCPS